jgi:GMP synthase (glutamine-hydrolysing)
MKPVLVIQNCAAESAGTIVDYLSSRTMPFSLVRSYEGVPLPATDEISAVINLGCPYSVTTYQNHQFLKDLFNFVSTTVRTDTPYLGICFGGQMLARVLGAEVRPNKVKEIGTSTVRLTDGGKSDPLFDSFDSSFPVFQWHSDTFKIPFGAAQLAEGDLCANQAFRTGRQVALQFHLETRPADVALWCDQYANELAEVNVKKSDLLADYDRYASQITNLSFKFLDNFFRVTSK